MANLLKKKNAQFAAKTRHTAIHVSIKNRIQHIAKLQPVSKQQVCSHCHNFLTLRGEALICEALNSLDVLV